MMKIEQTAFEGYKDAYRLINGDVELIVVAEVGPRILSLRLGDGPNLLFHDTPGAFVRGNWHLRGGHRIWIAPEDERCYAPDNSPCEVRESGDGFIDFIAPVGPPNLRKTLNVGVCPKDGQFVVKTILSNEGPMVAQGAIWNLTCALPEAGAVVVVPWADGSDAWNTPMIRYWRSWVGLGTDIESPQWKTKNDYFLLEPTGERGKVGLFSKHGVLALLRKDATFIKRVKAQPGAVYPDGGCNIELFTCPEFIELELLSPMQVINPGSQISLSEHWTLTDKVFTPEQYQELVALTATHG